jgi:hypothetical protein
MIKILASYYKKVDKVFIKSVPQNAKYISPTIQKEILHVIAMKIYKMKLDWGFHFSSENHFSRRFWTSSHHNLNI